jgi:Annexin
MHLERLPNGKWFIKMHQMYMLLHKSLATINVSVAKKNLPKSGFTYLVDDKQANYYNKGEHAPAMRGISRLIKYTLAYNVNYKICQARLRGGMQNDYNDPNRQGYVPIQFVPPPSGFGQQYADGSFAPTVQPLGYNPQQGQQGFDYGSNPPTQNYGQPTGYAPNEYNLSNPRSYSPQGYGAGNYQQPGQQYYPPPAQQQYSSQPQYAPQPASYQYAPDAYAPQRAQPAQYSYGSSPPVTQPSYASAPAQSYSSLPPVAQPEYAPAPVQYNPPVSYEQDPYQSVQPTSYQQPQLQTPTFAPIQIAPIAIAPAISYGNTDDSFKGLNQNLKVSPSNVTNSALPLALSTSTVTSIPQAVTVSPSTVSQMSHQQAQVSPSTGSQMSHQPAQISPSTVSQMSQQSAQVSPSTLTPNISQEVDKVRGSMRDEQTLTTILGRKSPSQMREFQQAFFQSCNRELHLVIDEQTKGDFGKLLVAFTTPQFLFDAQCIQEAVSGFSKNENLLIEVLANRSQADMRNIKETYKYLYKKDLENEVSNEFRGNMKQLFISLVQGMDGISHLI